MLGPALGGNSYGCRGFREDQWWGQTTGRVPPQHSSARSFIFSPHQPPFFLSLPLPLIPLLSLSLPLPLHPPLSLSISSPPPPPSLFWEGISSTTLLVPPRGGRDCATITRHLLLDDLETLFKNADTDGDGHLSYGNFDDILRTISHGFLTNFSRISQLYVSPPGPPFVTVL